MTFLVNNYGQGDQVYLFGFSRGSSGPRSDAFVDRTEASSRSETPTSCPSIFGTISPPPGTGDPNNVKTATGEVPGNPMVAIQVDMLGVWDT